MKISGLIFILCCCFAGSALSKCPDIKKVYGKDWNQGFVDVPIDWNNFNSKKIQVSYYYKNQPHLKNKTPIVFFNGGPTIEGHLGIRLFSTVEGLKDENLIFIDQRGTGCSTPFPEYNLKTQNEFRHFTSESIVNDAEVIREKLFGRRKWKVFGQSYGGHISFRYIEKHPEHISSAHIHGFGASEGGAQLFSSREKSIQKITDELLDYKDLSRSQYSIRELMDKLLANDDFVKVCFDVKDSLSKKFCGPDIFTALFMASGFKNHWKNILYYLNRMNEKLYDAELLFKEVKKFVNTYILRFNNPSQAAALSIIFYIELSPGVLFHEGCVEENTIISECRFKRKFFPRLEQKPEVSTSPLDLEMIKENIKKYDLNINYYGGKYDTFMPKELLVDTARVLDIEDRLQIFEKSGHEGFYTEAKLIKKLIED